MTPCPCGEPLEYAACCEPLHRGASRAATAVQLMRSRYAAYCQGELDYLLSTLHPDRHQGNDRQAVAAALAEMTWRGLKILESSQGGPDDDDGMVEFEAEYVSPAGPGILRERSRFVKEMGSWFYVEGKLLPPRHLATPPGRNDPCPCGSGKKFKKCCG